MEFSIKTIDGINDVVAHASPCLVVGVYADPKAHFTVSGATLDAATGHQLSAVLATGDLNTGVGSMAMLYHPTGVRAARILLVELGERASFSLNRMREAARAAAKKLEQCHITRADCLLLDELGHPTASGAADDKTRPTPDPSRYARALVEAMSAALYDYGTTKSMPTSRHLEQVQLFVARADLAAVEMGVAQGRAIANAVRYAKDLANLPGNHCTPSYLASEAIALQSPAITTTIIDAAQMKKLGMGALLSVARGSREPPKLIIMHYHGGRAKEPPVVLVGKGLTFDAGGISLKPAAAMDEMKYDMCGGASVFGSVRAAAELVLPLNVVGIVPSSENLPDGAANKPGDVVTSMAGLTIEILNTDAEGRLILCDALTYAARFKPAALVDIATLTGACVIALGRPASGLFSNDTQLAQELLSAGTAAGDRAWQLPLWDEYDKQLESSFADLANIGGKGGGAVTAACFLKQFTREHAWAHLDIAGTAWQAGKEKGATGRPVPLLVEFLLQRCRQ